MRDGGGLMSYGAIAAEPYRRIAAMVDKILKGSKPAEIPVEQPTKFEFVINLKAAKQWTNDSARHVTRANRIFGNEATVCTEEMPRIMNGGCEAGLFLRQSATKIANLKWPPLALCFALAFRCAQQPAKIHTIGWPGPTSSDAGARFAILRQELRSSATLKARISPSSIARLIKAGSTCRPGR